MTAIRPLEMNDFPDWLPLWVANNMGRNNEAVTAETWSRLCDPSSPVNGFAAFKGDKLVGILHYILHETTGYIAPACYMQDLFVAEDRRGQGIAKELLKALEKKAQEEKWSKIYWLAEAGNAAAQALYKNFGTKINFTSHILPVTTT